MLKFSVAQVKRLDDVFIGKCAMRFADFLRENFPDAVALPHESLLDAVIEQMERARAHGLQEERHQLCYLVTAWLLGARFDQDFAAPRLVLDDPAYNADEKAEWLEDWSIELLQRLSPGTVVPDLGALS